MIALTKFMRKKLNSLPESVRNSYDEILEMDKKCSEKRKKLARICFLMLKEKRGSEKSGKKASSSPSKRNPKRKMYTEAMGLLGEIEQLSTEKLHLASECYEEVDKYIIELDKAYGKFAKNIGAGNQVDKKLNKVGRKKKSRLYEVVETDATVDSMDFDSPLVEMPVDPNEPTYCTCHQVSFGQMICCDNKECLIEWFHFNCVGLKTVPKGKWYCEACKEKMADKRRKSASDKK